MRNMSQKIYKRIACVLISLGLLIPTNMPVYATQNRTSNYSRAFTLTGNGANDIVSVAMAQVGKTGSQLGYSEEWCADFVSDCAALANQGNVIPRDGYCPNLQSNIIRAGGEPVSISSAQKGDIVFYGPGGANHVEIVYANNNGRISTIGGNSGSGSSCYSRSVRDHSYQTMTITKVLRPNYGHTPANLPGTVDTSWNVPTNVTASRRISTYDQYGNVESNHYIDPGDNCYIPEVYTNGFVKIQYPVSGGMRWAYAKAADFSLKKKEVSVAKLPGTVDTSWNVPINVIASRRISTYDQYGNVESNHYIDPGDNCYIPEVYTNGFVKIQYPVSGGMRWAYAKASDFSLQRVTQGSTIPDTNLHAWFSSDKMGGEASNLRLDEFLYLCYRVETKDGNILDPSIGNYSVTETIFYPNGDKHTYCYGKSNNNWIGSRLNQWGTYRGVVEISGDYTGTVEVAYTLSKDSCTHKFSSWTITKKATCTSEGTEHRKCSLCGKVESRTIKATGHKYTNKVVAPTTTHKGYTVHTCTTCGYSFKDNYTEYKRQLSYILVTQKPKKTEYYVSEKIDTTGMKVIAGYSDKTQREVTGWTISGDTSEEGNTSVIVKYTENGKTVSTYYRIVVKKRTDERITITYDSCGGDLGVKNRGGIIGVMTSVWSEIPKKNYQLTLDPNGGTVSNKMISIRAPFIAWYSSPGAKGTRYNTGQTVSFKNSMTLYAAYEKASVGNLPSPSRDGYIFEGWYFSSGTKVTSATQISDNYTLTAKWQEEVKETPHVHTKGEWETVREATMTAPGEQVLRCQECGQIMQTEAIPILIVSDTDSKDDTLMDKDIVADDPVAGNSEFNPEDDPIYDPVEEPDDESFLVGDEITTNREIFTVTKIGKNPSVEYTELFDEDITDVVIPESITIYGVTYKVTSIAPKAFYKNTSIKSVTLTSSVTKIGSKAFYGCTSLKNIVIFSTKLKSNAIGTNAFTKVGKNVKVYVPSAKYKTYKTMLKKAGIGSKAKIYRVMFNR